jgi:diguanylate cyclase (GGDEF)-like protein
MNGKFKGSSEKLEIMFQGQVLNSLTVSMGVAIYPDSGTTIDDVMRTADIALYKAKQAGRDRITPGAQFVKIE